MAYSTTTPCPPSQHYAYCIMDSDYADTRISPISSRNWKITWNRFYLFIRNHKRNKKGVEIRDCVPLIKAVRESKRRLVGRMRGKDDKWKKGRKWRKKRLTRKWRRVQWKPEKERKGEGRGGGGGGGRGGGGGGGGGGGWGGGGTVRMWQGWREERRGWCLRDDGKI